MRRPSCRRHGALLIEVVCGLGLLGLVLAGVYAGLHVSEDALRHHVRQRQALDILDNAVERLAAEAPVSRQRCDAVLAEELARSPLAEAPGVTAACEPDPAGGIRCRLHSPTHLLAEVRIGAP
ncbi:MAG: hypothetical protein GX595_13380 [Lentisphaerae bacterium]|nr:hypothetical protein [Lentisphaerota bacterium]